MSVDPRSGRSCFRVTVRTRSPVTVATGHRVVGGPLETLPYLPGTAFRGALAGRMLRRGVSPDDPLFRGLFTLPEVRYGPLYPILGEGAMRSLPLPATARSCKLAPGFRQGSDGQPSRGHGVIDALVARAYGRDHEGPYVECNYAGDTEACPGEMVPHRGFYAAHAERFWACDASTHLVVRTALSTVREVAAHGQLYAVEALDGEQEFCGYVCIPSAQADDMERELGRAEVLRIGAIRTRGQGEVQVVSSSPMHGTHLDLPPLTKRVEALDAAWRDAWPEDRFVFAITLYSDAILYDAYMRCQSAITPEVLHHYGRYDTANGRSPWPVDLRLEDAVGDVRRVSGWNAAHRLPRWDAIAVCASSVYVLSVPSADRDRTVRLLAEIETHGLGERRREGFGQVIVAHPFHLQQGGTV